MGAGRVAFTITLDCKDATCETVTGLRPRGTSHSLLLWFSDWFSLMFHCSVFLGRRGGGSHAPDATAARGVGGQDDAHGPLSRSQILLRRGRKRCFAAKIDFTRLVLFQLTLFLLFHRGNMLFLPPCLKTLKDLRIPTANSLLLQHVAVFY